MDEIEKIRKKIKKEAEELFEMDEESDIPISEKRVKDKKIRNV